MGKGFEGTSWLGVSKLLCRATVGLEGSFCREGARERELLDCNDSDGVRLDGEPSRFERGDVNELPFVEGFAGLLARGEEGAVRPGDEGTVRTEGPRAKPVLPVLWWPRAGRRDGAGWFTTIKTVSRNRLTGTDGKYRLGLQ